MSVAAETALTCIQWRGAQARLAIARASQLDTLQITQWRQQTGPGDLASNTRAAPPSRRAPRCRRARMEQFLWRATSTTTGSIGNIFGDYSRLFKFPSGPHDYGRLFHINANSHGHHLRSIREFFITPSNSPNMAVLGFGEDEGGDVYVTGNVSGTPFGSGGVVLRLAPPPHHHGDHQPHDDD